MPPPRHPQNRRVSGIPAEGMGWVVPGYEPSWSRDEAVTPYPELLCD